MLKMIKAENLKVKHTPASILVWLAPIIIVCGSFLLNCSFGYGISLNMWYVSLLWVLIAATCSLVNQKEKKKLQYRNVYQLPISLSKVWRAKGYMIALKTIVSANILGLLVCIASLAFSGKIENGFITTMLGVNLCVLLVLWLIPVCLYMSKLFGFIVPIVIAGIVSVVGVLMAIYDNWIWNPLTWVSRVMCTVIKYQPNGVPATGEEGLFISNEVIVIVTVISVLLFIVLNFVNSLLFERRQRAC